MRADGLPNFGLLLDTFHMNIEEPMIQASIRACGERIFHFHVADSNRWYPGEATWTSQRHPGDARGHRLHGFVSGEFMPVPDAEPRRNGASRT